MAAEGIGIKRENILRQMVEILEPWVSDARLLDGITEKTNLLADLGLDSIGILQVVLGAEKEFGINIEDQELDSDTFSVMGNLVNLVQRKIHEDNRPAYKQHCEPAAGNCDKMRRS